MMAQGEIDGVSKSEFELALDRLDAVSQGRASDQGFQEVYWLVRQSYPDHRVMATDLALLARIAALARSHRDILNATEYLDRAQVPSVEYPELSLDRQALLSALSVEALFEGRGRNWRALTQDVSRFKSPYLAAYRAHHESLNNALPGYRRDLGSARLKLQALALSNTLAELGVPVGAGLNESLGELGEGPQACEVLGEELDLATVPWCDSCGLRLEQSLPIGQLDRVLAGIDMDLGGKNRNLSHLLVDQILQGSPDERLNDFLQIVQASGLSAPSNTLNPEIISFVRGMLN